jgi:hypothetical protein
MVSVPFRSQAEADQRLISDRTPLTEDEIRDLLPWARTLSASAQTILATELSLLQITALKGQEQLAERQLQSFDKFDKSTARANFWMILFTAAVTLLTLVMLLIALFGSPWAK